VHIIQLYENPASKCKRKLNAARFSETHGAYEGAGYQKHRGNAARLSANERVKDRVREIQSIGAERAAVTVHSLIEEAEQARIKAMESANGAAAAVSAVTAKAKLAGLWREKVDQHSTGTISTVWQVSWEDGEGGGGSDE
jgi:phage terminase small subunit